MFVMGCYCCYQNGYYCGYDDDHVDQKIVMSGPAKGIFYQ